MGFWLALYTMLCLCVTKFPLKIVNDFKGVYLIVRFFLFYFFVSVVVVSDTLLTVCGVNLLLFR
jgi:hypothetical protein